MIIDNNEFLQLLLMLADLSSLSRFSFLRILARRPIISSTQRPLPGGHSDY